MLEDKVSERERIIIERILVVLFKNHRLWEEDGLSAESAVMIKLHVVIKMYFGV